MEFPEETPAAPKPITVKQLVYRLRDTVSIAVGTQWVVGELSNVKHHTSGHVYFTLKFSAPFSRQRLPNAPYGSRKG